MTIEKRIKEMLGEGLQPNPATKNASAQEPSHIAGATDGATKVDGQNPDNARNNVENQEEAENATSKKPNVATKNAAAPEPQHKLNTASVKEDVDALMAGEELSEEFKEKAATIFEAAVLTRVKSEVTRIQEEFDNKLEEAVSQSVEGIVEAVDGYLGYLADKWISENEIALERGLKSDILESFVSGMKGLFEKHYIEVPDSKVDLVSSLEEEVAELERKLDESLKENMKNTKALQESMRKEVIEELSEDLSDLEAEKFMSLTEELSFTDVDTFRKKVTIVKENYFKNKTSLNESGSVVTDTPVDTLTEEKKLDPRMSAYASILSRKL